MEFNKDPKDNILFEDSQTAVLIQSGMEIIRVSMKDAEALDRLLREFVNFERPEVQNFRKAIELFKEDIPKVTETIREIIIDQGTTNSRFISARNEFLDICRESINPEIVVEDVREMIVQHILTEDIFNTIFDEPHFHRENNIARELEKVIQTFFTGKIRRSALSSVQHYYQTINAAAASIPDHHEKQKFLKVVYETFYKSYNPKAADRLGVVYTPNEIVKFLIESTDYLLYKHFGKFLDDRDVEILDPATGTGTFICDIIDYIQDTEKLRYKYQNELHANELAILPYYIANLNIEFTYKQKTGEYKEFENLCFVDTLDNMGFDILNQQIKLFGLSAENLDRIKKQNEKKISVIIGNPPYNANQKNENENNKNREYPEIDIRIKHTYINNSTAQKTKVYDMYARFYRWAMDRIDKNGIICFITNNSFINARTFDGFRKCIQDEFDYAYIIDLGGNIRELSGKDGIFLNERHTIFGVSAAVGIALMWLVKKERKEKNPCEIYYLHPCDIRATREEKLAFLNANKFDKINFDHIQPDKNNNWINIIDNDFEEFVPIADKAVKSGKSKEAIFEIFSLGAATNRDSWVFDISKENLINKMSYFSKTYNTLLNKNKLIIDDRIKWSRDLRKKFKNKKKSKFNEELITTGYYKPFTKLFFYTEKMFCDVLTSNHYQFFGKDLKKENPCIGYIGMSTVVPFSVLAFNIINDLNSLSNAANGNKTFPLYRYDGEGKRIDNITDWGLEQFQNHYNDTVLSKEDIFHYVYAVLHNPIYRKKYELNLKREYPCIPFYKDFKLWRDWGKQLSNLHINFERVDHYELYEITTSDEKNPKTKLKTDKEAGVIYIDENTILSGVPKESWDYKIGNRSALEWVLDQHKEKNPRDKTIAVKFNTYKFSKYKNNVIDLLKRVCKVSVETVKIMNEMEKIKRP